jgi:hypothetical protein
MSARDRSGRANTEVRHDGVVSSAVRRLVGVYDADGTALGELSYFVRARFGRAHCALCDITHGRVRERADWQTSRDRLPAPFATFHRDDQPDEVRRAAGSATPVVVAELDGGDLIVLLGPDDLEACAGSPDRLVERLMSAVAALDLTWPVGP